MSLKYRIELMTDKKNNYNNVSPNMIYNRFDLFSHVDSANVHLWKYTDKNHFFYFETLFDDRVLQLAIELIHLSEIELKRLIKFFFSKYKSIAEIRYTNALCSVGQSQQHNYFRIELPTTKSELDMTLSKKGRYNIKREKRLLEKDYECYQIKNYSVKDEKSVEIIEHYFKLKKVSHGIDYGLSAEQYCERYHVTDIYILSIGNIEQIIAIICSCEQCPNVYIENLTYDTSFSKYSPGQILYDEYLAKLIQKQKKGVYLFGGDYAYKKRYGSIEEVVYDGVVYRTQRGKEALNRNYRRIKRLLK